MAIATGPKIAEPKTSPKHVLAQAKDLQVKMVDFKFIDLPGLWQHFSIPVAELPSRSRAPSRRAADA